MITTLPLLCRFAPALPCAVIASWLDAEGWAGPCLEDRPWFASVSAAKLLARKAEAGGGELCRAANPGLCYRRQIAFRNRLRLLCIVLFAAECLQSLLALSPR